MDADFHELESEGFIAFTLTCTQYADECKSLIERGSDGGSHYLLFSFWGLQQEPHSFFIVHVAHGIIKKNAIFRKGIHER